MRTLTSVMLHVRVEEGMTGREQACDDPVTMERLRLSSVESEISEAGSWQVASGSTLKRCRRLAPSGVKGAAPLLRCVEECGCPLYMHHRRQRREVRGIEARSR